MATIAGLLAIWGASNLAVCAEDSFDPLAGDEPLAASASSVRIEDLGGPLLDDEIPAANASLLRIPDATLPMIGYGQSDSQAWFRRVNIGGYGDMHWNYKEGPGGDQFDLHRFVLDIGVQFSERLSLQSELEIEHAFVSKSSGGETLFEQAFIEYALCDPLRIRAGRILVPVGIINARHEPPSFNGVERPSFAKYIIPSTWSADGIGIRGWLLPSLTYDAYMVTSLDGSKFSAKDGIRGGRLKERPSQQETAFTGRLDWFPFAMRPAPHGQLLRIGVSTFLGGLNNGNKGVNPGIDANLSLISADVEYTIYCFDFRGVFAYEEIDGALALPVGTASEIFGGYLEAAVHVWPEAWCCGRLRRADAIVFVRYDDYNTQYRLPPGVAKTLTGDRDEWTFGFGFLPQPNFAIKFDYQFTTDASAGDPADRINVGLAWSF